MAYEQTILRDHRGRVQQIVTERRPEPDRQRGGRQWLVGLRAGLRRAPAAPTAGDMTPEPGALVDKFGVPIWERQRAPSASASAPGTPPEGWVPGIDYRPAPRGMSADQMRYWIAWYRRLGQLWP